MFSRLVTCIIAALGLILPTGMVMAINPAWASAAGLDVWNYSRLESRAKEAGIEEQLLTQVDEEIHQRIELKERLVGELIAGKRSLAEVTTRFLALNEGREACMTTIRVICPGRTDEECVARNVVGYALLRMQGTPSEQAVVVNRLNRELRQLTGESGKLDAQH